jgi:iron complex outermembrane receptor protein
MKNHTAFVHLLAGTALGLGLAGPARAQDGNEGASAGDIIVTARRVEERLQDVPISMTVFSQEKLSQENVFSARDLAIYTPSLTANSRFGADFASFAIRGFTQEARTTASVGVYFADVVMPRSSGMSAAGDGAGPGAMFDLQNVQVLKGPQGTLFGRNTTGGAVILMPKRPTDEVEGYVEGSVGNHNLRRIQSVINLPLAETLRVRAGVDWQKRDGYLKNVSGYGPRDFADIDYVAARFSVLWDVAPDVENYTVASYTKSTPNGAVPKITDCHYNPRAGQVPASAPFILGCQQIAREQNQGRHAVTGWLPFASQSLETWQVINNTKWQVSDTLTIKNIVSFGQVTQDQAVDLFGVWNPVGATLTLPTGTAPFFRTVAVPAQYQGMGWGSSTSIGADGAHAGDQRTFTEELQFQGTSADGSLNWQAGAYYERSTPVGFSGTQSMEGVFCNSREEWRTFRCTDASIVTGSPSPTGSRNYQVGKINYRNIGLYAQATYKFTDQLSVDGGIRYTWDKSWGSGRTVGVQYTAATGWNTPRFICTFPGLVYSDSFEDCGFDVRQSSKAPTWMLGVNFKPIEDVLLYAKYSRGYRQGSISPIAAFGFKSYEPEKVDVYEAGLKSSFDGAVRGTFNVSGFYNDFSNMQLQVAFQDLLPNTSLPPLSPNPAIVNAGSARIWGVEAEATLQPVEGLTLNAAYSYLNTKLTDFVAPDLSGQITNGYDTVSSAPKVGSRLQFTPKYKLTLGANYRLPIAEEAGKASFGITFVRTGSVYYGEDLTAALRVGSIFTPDSRHYPSNVAPAYNLLNLNFAFENIAQSNLSLFGFVTNVTNTLYYDSRSLSGSRGFNARYIGEPRMYGMRVRYSF